MPRKVRFVKLHQGIFVPGTGSLSDTLEPSRHSGIVMFYTTEGVEITYKNINFIVPLANVACAVFDEPPPTARFKAA